METTTANAPARIPKVYGLGAEFPTAAALFAAAEKVRDLGFRRWDVHSPFPIHGMDKAMGLGKSWLSGVVLVGGITGLLTATALTMYPALLEYRTVVHGKPTTVFTVPAFFPIMFELTILLSAFAAIGALMVMTGLPRWNHPVFNWQRFNRMTDDGFFLVIEARDQKFSEAKTRQLLEELGGQHVTLIHD
jgi:hypothetical protein